MTTNNHRRGLRSGQKVTWVGVMANTLLMAFKFFAGVFGHSQALIADAVHSVSDLFTDIIVLFGIRIGRKGPDEDHPFGHARLETLASAIVGVALIITACYLGITAAFNIHRHAEYIPTPLALIGAGVSIAVKEALYHYTVRVGRRIHSQLIVANAWHHRTDSLSSVAVFLGVAGSLINPDWHTLDAFAALLVSFFIIKVGIDILWDSIREFTDTAPPPEILQEIKGCASGVAGVMDIHDVRVRSSGGLYLMEAHIVVDGNQTVSQGHRIAKEVERCLLDDVVGVERVIVHVDPADDEEAQGERKAPSP
ncbi:MAG: cation diffusion facilitator family transporter [Deltaproteobacteria bacterium]|nr:cation diffusion facilitator family transporter [Deltaproteobacteria bacterium]